MQNESESGFKYEIEGLAKGGIKADRKHLIEDIGAQFANHREWIREYVVNAFDAGATSCRVSGKQDGNILTIFVEDNGHGMNEQGVKDFMTLFRSTKKGDPAKTIGRFGVGKASIIAIPGISGLRFQTSTGKECWKAEVEGLTKGMPVKIKKYEVVPDQGTRFEIFFQMQKNVTLERELKMLGDVLEKYVRFLPMTITVLEQSNHESPEGKHGNHLRIINHGEAGRAIKRYSAHLTNRAHCSIELSFGKPVHELYQNNVMITDRYNLISHDIAGEKNKLIVPYLQIRVDSASFELPFGRHCLRNEEVLVGLAKFIRVIVLPDYFDQLRFYHSENSLEELEIKFSEVAEMACSLLLGVRSTSPSWNSFPIFKTTEGDTLTFQDVQKVTKKKGSLYLADKDNPGADYSVFESLVLSSDQPKGAIDVLNKRFSSKIVNLGFDDLVIEQPRRSGPPLGKDEKAFESHIGFHPDVSPAVIKSFESVKSRNKGDWAEIGRRTGSLLSRPKNGDIFGDSNKKSQIARKVLEKMRWRVNYLVGKDGKTPCVTHRFLYKDSTVILNLHHPEVQKLLLLSKTKPALAGHWSLSMCLLENNKILSHMSPVLREEIIKEDALARIHSKSSAANAREENENQNAKRILNTFMDDVYSTFGLDLSCRFSANNGTACFV